MNWLLLRGLAREQTHWGVFPSRLQSAFPGSRIRFLDLPGTGTEFNRDSPLTVGAIAADLRERWLTSAERDPEDTWGIIGIS
ncbi:MAG: alpha/beta hydrolase, partial [Oligoflexia bacterium]|nr:alpha/beta hydrolase [Oligoflexia bacterium]